jgi:septal ring factor EnvC (AmiA/AmiB activator)
MTGHPAGRSRYAGPWLAGACAALVLSLAAGAQAQQQELKDIERALDADRARAQELQRQAEALEQEIQALRVESVSVARAAQDHESRMSEVESQLADLERQEAQKTADLHKRRTQLGLTLAALQRIALQPTDTLLLAPGPPLDTVRSGMLLRAVIPAIEGRAAALRKELSDLAALRKRISTRRQELARIGDDLAAERARLDVLIRRKSETRAKATAEQKAANERVARLAARAADLRDLMEKIEREAAARAAREAEEARRRAAQEAKKRAEAEAKERAARAQQAAPSASDESAKPAPGDQLALARPPDIRPFPDSGSSLIMPARGRLTTRYGQTGGDGRPARGIVIAARPGAQVVAPFDGKVVYAGNFRSYGQILIIQHGGRYHTLLAGLDRVDAVVGQWLLAGEPVGIMGAPRGGDPELYLELRHAGKPINPLPWLATSGPKVRG